jgi:hypothetical protein
LAELALFDRDPGAYETKTAAKSRPPSEVVTIDGPAVGRFLEFLRTEERTERYRRNIQHYLATWGKFYAGQDIFPAARLSSCTSRRKSSKSYLGFATSHLDAKSLKRK